MKQMDATATPMSDCFNSTANYAQLTSLPSNVRRDQLNPQAAAMAEPLLRDNALASARPPLAKAPQCSEHERNRILWPAMKGAAAVYPHGAVIADDGDDDGEGEGDSDH